MPPLFQKFRGCLVGGAIGDIAGAVVEAESPGYISSHFRSVDDILAVETVPEFMGEAWRVGRFTDDTQMMIAVARWLLDDPSHSPELLLATFAEMHEPWRRYGPGTEAILRMFAEHRSQWRELATAMFPFGSYGNGSAMRVAPIGLAYSHDVGRASDVARISSRPTHSHPLASQGAVMQTIAVATAVGATDFDAGAFLRPMCSGLKYFSDLLQDTSPFQTALDEIEQGLKRGAPCAEMSHILGTGVTAQEAVPMAIYCFLRHPHSFADVVHQAVFIGGDTDTIACMAGAIAGAFLGSEAIPDRWKDAIHEEEYPVAEIERLADRLLTRYRPFEDDSMGDRK